MKAETTFTVNDPNDIVEVAAKQKEALENAEDFRKIYRRKMNKAKKDMD
jgi:hypothetical protein